MIRVYDDDGEYFKIPNLGKHFTLKKPSTLDEPAASPSTNVSPTASSSKSTTSSSHTTNGNATTTNGTSDPPSVDGTKGSPKKKPRARKATANKDKEAVGKGNFGVFTQRLLQSLLEEPMDSIANLDEDEDAANANDESIHPSGATSNVLKALSLGNTAQLEKRIKKELQDCGLLDLDDSVTNDVQNAGDEDDEVLKELLASQNELRFIINQNKGQLLKLHSAVEVNLMKQQLETQLATVDEEVKEGYKKLQSIKAKKRNPSKKERDFCLKALKEREEITKKLDELQVEPSIAD